MPLPFVVAPTAPTTRRIGDDRVGVLEVPVRGGLTVPEGEYIADVLDTMESSHVVASRTAEAIATAEEGVTLTEAKLIVDRYADGEEFDGEGEEVQRALVERHRTTLDAARQHLRAYFRLYRHACVAAMCIHRLNAPEYTVEALRSGGAVLDRVHYDALYAIAQEEQEAEPRTDAPAPSEEELGKPPAASGSRRARTGRR